MHPARPAYGVRKIFPFLREVAPATLRPVPASRLAGLTLAIDATLVGTRFHFADDPHPARHLFGFYRLVRSLRALDARPIMVFDHPLGGMRARNPAKLQEAERRRAKRALIARRAEIEKQRFKRIKLLSAAVAQYARLDGKEAAQVQQLLHDAHAAEVERQEAGVELASQLMSSGEPREGAIRSIDPGEVADELGAPQPPSGKPPAEDDNVPTSGDSEVGWDEHVDNSLWDELIQDDKVAAASLAITDAFLATASLPQAGVISADERPPSHIKDLAYQLHVARLQFVELHPQVALDSHSRSDTESIGISSGVESKSQAALTAAEARIHAKLLHHKPSKQELDSLPVDAEVEQSRLTNAQEAAALQDDNIADGSSALQDHDSAATAAVPSVLQPDLLLGDEESGPVPECKETLGAQTEDAILDYDVEVNAIHSQSNALSKSYNRASNPLKPQTIIDCAYLCALMGVPVLFTSRGSGSAAADAIRQREAHAPSRHLIIPGAAWAGNDRLRSRAHEAEALAASLVHAGFADIVASEDSDVLMYDVPMLRGLLGHGGSGQLKGMVWVDSKEVRRTLFGVSDEQRAVKDAEGVLPADHTDDVQAVVEHDAPAEEHDASTSGLPKEVPKEDGQDEDVDARLPMVTFDDVLLDDLQSTNSQALKEPKKLTPDEENRRRFHDFALLLGTDFNRTIPGVGPKIAYSLIKEHGSIPAILRLRKAPSLPAEARSQNKSVPSPERSHTSAVVRKAEFRFDPPPSLSRREFVLELNRARAVFNRPPTLYGNLGRLRRWAAGGDYFDWRRAVARSSTKEGEGGGGKALDEQKRQALVREEEQWRRQQISRLFRQHGVRRLPDGGQRTSPRSSDPEPQRDFGNTLDSFVNDLGAQAQAKGAGIELGDQPVPALATSPSAVKQASIEQVTKSSFEDAGADMGGNPFGADIFKERDTPSGKAASALLLKTARSAKKGLKRRAAARTDAEGKELTTAGKARRRSRTRASLTAPLASVGHAEARTRPSGEMDV